jgi:hypothetical protein
MRETLHETISVLFLSDRDGGRPVKLRWQGKTRPLLKLGFHHTVREGRVLHHIYSMSDDVLFYRLDFNTETLKWSLEEVSDGLAT